MWVSRTSSPISAVTRAPVCRRQRSWLVMGSCATVCVRAGDLRAPDRLPVTPGRHLCAPWQTSPHSKACAPTATSTPSTTSSTAFPPRSDRPAHGSASTTPSRSTPSSRASPSPPCPSRTTTRTSWTGGRRGGARPLPAHLGQVQDHLPDPRGTQGESGRGRALAPQHPAPAPDRTGDQSHRPPGRPTRSGDQVPRDQLLPLTAPLLDADPPSAQPA